MITDKMHKVICTTTHESSGDSYRTYTNSIVKCSCGWRTEFPGQDVDSRVEQHRRDVVEALLGLRFTVHSA